MDRNTYTSSNVAVVLPCFSWPQYLSEALSSVHAQTLTPGLVVAVLDGPPNSQEYREILARRPGIEPIWLASNQGPSTARNAGAWFAEQMGFKWLVFLDEDDLLHPRFLEKMLLSASLCPDRDIHYCDWVKFGKWTGYTRTPEYTYDRLLAGPFMMSTSLIKMEAWRDVEHYNGHGFDPALRGWEDWCFFCEAGALGHYGARVGLGLVRYRKHVRSISDQAHERLGGIVEYIRGKLHQFYAVDVTYEAPAGDRCPS
jgi:glycosyltransferase involved in cell wall biosynthesis